ncbi:glycosyltransferase [Winogradskyella rapida]|uniref:Glycosyltransferase n=1 Tax=Winogradskyella rapida TaxID=549701 RepID=A0ABW3KTY9_9FLAO
MQSNHKKRICIVSRSLSEGGADRVAAMQSIFLSDLGYEVFVVSILNSIKYPYRGKLLNLGAIKEQEDTRLGRFKRLLILKKFLNDNAIDLVIDHRVRCKAFSEYIISGLIYPKATIYMVHNYTINRYFPPFKWLTKLSYGRSKKIVAVSDHIKNKVEAYYNFKQVQTIYNPVDFEYLNQLKKQAITAPDSFIFWYGRFEEKQKNVSLLVEAYSKSQLSEKGIKLLLMGQGKDKQKIETLIRTLGVQDHIEVLPFSKNPFPYIYQSKFTALTSHYEGFPMTVLESLACEIPVVSVKYKNYEDGVIKHEFNGLLVENYNAEALGNAFNRFIDDEKLYLRCKANTKKSVASFSVESISKQWQNLIDN